MTKLGIIILHYGALKTTEACLRSLKQKINQHQLILINNTKDDVSSLVKIIPGTKLIDNRSNLGFAKAVNQGITLGLSDKEVTHLFLMNNDLEISYGSFDELLRTYLKYPQAGIVSPVLHHTGGYDWGGRYNRFLALVKHQNWPNKPKTILTVDHVAGAAMLIPRALVEKIGMLDERFFLYFEDLDFCLRASAAGFTTHLNPQVVAEHAVSQGSNLLARTLHQWRSHILFVAKHLPVTAFPTAIITDMLIYPLITFKALFIR